MCRGNYEAGRLTALISRSKTYRRQIQPRGIHTRAYVKLAKEGFCCSAQPVIGRRASGGPILRVHSGVCQAR